MRLIDADALERAVMMMSDDDLCEDCCYNVVNAIDEMPTIGGWISVKDRLPGVCEDALVYIERDAWGNSNTPHRKRCIDIGCHVENGSWNIPNCGKKTLVLAWMPLPEPPKEVTGDEV